MKQEEAFEILKTGNNVFLTGEAGSGKTYLLQKYIDFLEDKGVKTAITASTGIAATHIDGVTIHSWSGMGVNNTLSDRDISHLLDRKYLHKHFDGTRVLIIDEVSMLTANQLDMIDRICKAFKESKLPFGGMQVVLSGDFYQLPPVSKQKNTDFVFKSHIWRDMDIKVCYLTDQFRHKDSDLYKLLSKIRSNSIDKKARQYLNKRSEIKHDEENITRLYTHNKDVDKINLRKLEDLNTNSFEYKMSSKGDSKLVDILKKNCLAKEKLILKKGAYVMFIKNNFDKGYVNGTLGKIVAFKDITNYPVVETESGDKITVTPKKWKLKEAGEIKAEVEQIPLKLAWAITVHKSQGMSLDKAEIDLRKCFIKGMGYVALSRLRCLEGLYLKGFNKKSLLVDQKISKIDKKLRSKSKDVLSLLNDKDEEALHNIQQDFIQSSV
ncbi:MAG: ATP-dependent RecD-like DNA helicase [Candidatus Paceibacteria bacterium]